MLTVNFLVGKNFPNSFFSEMNKRQIKKEFYSFFLKKKRKMSYTFKIYCQEDQRYETFMGDIYDFPAAICPVNPLHSVDASTLSLDSRKPGYYDPNNPTTLVLDKSYIGNAMTHVGPQGPPGLSITGPTGNDGLSITGPTGNNGLSITGPTGPASGEIFILKDEKTSGTSSGSVVAATWTQRTLNTMTQFPFGSTAVSIDANGFTASAGTYHIEASAPASGTSLHQIRLYNNTDAVVVSYGTSEVTNRSLISSIFTVTTLTNFSIEHYCTSSDGLGLAVSSGGLEQYTMVVIKKLA
jgi:hypothetical protein